MLFHRFGMVLLAAFSVTLLSACPDDEGESRSSLACEPRSDAGVETIICTEAQGVVPASCPAASVEVPSCPAAGRSATCTFSTETTAGPSVSTLIGYSEATRATLRMACEAGGGVYAEL